MSLKRVVRDDEDCLRTGKRIKVNVVVEEPEEDISDSSDDDDQEEEEEVCIHTTALFSGRQAVESRKRLLVHALIEYFKWHELVSVRDKTVARLATGECFLKVMEEKCYLVPCDDELDKVIDIRYATDECIKARHEAMRSGLPRMVIAFADNKKYSSKYKASTLAFLAIFLDQDHEACQGVKYVAKKFGPRTHMWDYE